ncbi:MAG: hypothetical protein NTZ17_09400 [Phycisphaerae bacterium]|nr:hypothetical protein [Phycisphaerae bacterium]
MSWDIWDSVFHDNAADIARYDLPDSKEVQVQENAICLGSSELRPGKSDAHVESFLRPKLAHRYRDVDVCVTLQILGTAKTNGMNEDGSCWFGIVTRAVQPDHWDSYLFYIRRDGRIEFATRYHKMPSESPPPVPAVSSQPVTVRIKAERDHIQTWVNNRQYHDWRDQQHAFLRKGDVYLIAYGSRVRISAVEIKVKKWHAPILQFVNRFWPWITAISIVVGLIIGLGTLWLWLQR